MSSSRSHPARGGIRLLGNWQANSKCGSFTHGSAHRSPAPMGLDNNRGQSGKFSRSVAQDGIYTTTCPA